jgi:hypothetical protein
LPNRDDAAEVKKRVSDRLLPLDYVSGVGGQGSGLTVYLARALEPEEKQHVGKILAVEAPGKPVEFVTSGKFEKR